MRTMFTDEHGGGCCGISHIVCFNADGSNQGELDSNIAEALSGIGEYDDDTNQYTYKGDKPSHLIEVALTDTQMMTWAPILKGKGFELGPRFYNDNSGNHVTLLTLKTQTFEEDNDPPYKW